MCLRIYIIYTYIYIYKINTQYIALRLDTKQLPLVSREVDSVVEVNVVCEAAVTVVCDVAAVAVVFDETEK